MNTHITSLAEKALLVKLTIRRAALTKRNDMLTQQLRMDQNDASLTVLTELFKNKLSPINEIKSSINEVYTFHRTHSLPYVDNGPRLVPSHLYLSEYIPNIKRLIARKDALMAKYMPDYDAIVADDLSYRRAAAQAAGKVSSASIDDYPTRDEFEGRMSIEFRPSPLPDKRHFLFDLSDEDLAKVDAAEEEIKAAAHMDVLQRMMKPLGDLTARLTEYKGEKGERFHNSLIANVLEGCDLAEKLALYPTPEFLAEIATLRDTAKKCMDNVELLKGSATVRDKAKARLDEVAKRMAAFM